MHRGAVAVTAERHIGAMRVEPGRREDMAAIDRHALRLVDRRGIAMIDMGIEFEIDVDAFAIVEPNRQPLGACPFDRSERAILDPHRFLVAQEKNAVLSCKFARSALGLDRDARAERALRTQAFARRIIEHFRSEEHTSELQSLMRISYAV